MTNSKSKFITRSPRYIISDEDDNIIIFTSDQKNSTSCRADCLNISGSGLGFIVENDYAPDFGEIIKLDFNIPNQNKVSWWGRVVRLSEYSEEKWWKQNKKYENLVFVAIHFHDIPDGQREQIEDVLRIKFRNIQKAKLRALIQAQKDFLKLHLKSIILYFSLILLTFCFLWLLTLPFGNYDKDHGSPWGQRFRSILKSK